VGIPGIKEPEKLELCIETWNSFVDSLKEIDPHLSGHDIIDLAIRLNKERYSYPDIEGQNNRHEYEELLQVVTSLFEGMAHLQRDMMVDFIGRHSEISAHLEGNYGSIIRAIQTDCGTATIDESGPYFFLSFFGEDARRDFGYMDTSKSKFPLLAKIDEAKDCFMHSDDWAAALAAAVAKLKRKTDNVNARKLQRKATRKLASWMLNRRLNRLRKKLYGVPLDAPYRLGLNRQRGYNPELTEQDAATKYDRVLKRDEIAKRVVLYLVLDTLFCNNPLGRAFAKFIGMDTEMIGSICENLTGRRGVIASTNMANIEGNHPHFDLVKGHKFLREIVFATGGGLISAGLAFGPKERIPMEILLPPRPKGAVDLNK
jgi:hypothetical protein